MRALGYRPHASARALKSNRSRILGLIVPYHRCTDAPGQYRYIVSLAAACRRHGAHIIMGSDAHIDIDVGEHGYTHAILAETDFPDELVLNGDPARLKAWIRERHALNAVHGLDYFS